MEDDDKTQQVSGRDPSAMVQSSLELHVRIPDGTVHVLPLHRSTLDCDVPGGPILRFSLREGEVSFRNLSPEQTIYKDGKPISSGRLEVGSFLEAGAARVLLWDHGRTTAYLKGYSAPYSGDIWPLPPGVHRLGRPGRRDNAINLDHPTVSREHATLQAEDSRYRLLAESATNPVCVAGTTVEPGQTVDLTAGDLIEIGDLVLRFHWHGAEETAPTSGAQICTYSMGTFRAKVGDTTINDKDWKTQQIKWMFAHLAYQWGRPVPIEALIEELWPDFAIEKGKNNLNYSLSILRQTIRGCLPESMKTQETVLRSSSTLQLNPDLLDSHDVVNIQRHLESATRMQKEGGPRWEEHITQALADYTGPFLNDCYLDWVAPIRQSVELEMLDATKRLLEARAARSAWSDMVGIATQALKIDPCSSWGCLSLMQAYRHTHSPAEALRVFEQHRKTLDKELAAEPSSDVLREQQMVKALL